MMPFGGLVEAQARGHARRTYPFESVGCVLQGNMYRELENLSTEPRESFRVTTMPDDALALIHSHPDHLPCPSAADMAQQQATAIPWGIISTDGEYTSEVEWFGDELAPAPYFGREFLSGTRDCWALIRDWYRGEHGVVLDNIPRDEDWYKHGLDLLSLNNIKAAGFYRLNGPQDLRVGDVILGTVGSRVVNHCGMYLRNGLILHHIYSKVSCKEPLNNWLKYCNYFLRHKTSDQWIDSANNWLGGKS